MTTFHFTIQTPEKEVYQGDATKVHFASELGELEILPKYADFLGALGYSRVTVSTPDGKSEFVGRRGVFSFDQASNSGKLLLLDCHLDKEFTAVSAQEYIAFLEEKIASGELVESQLKFVEEEKYMLEKQLMER